MLVWSIEQGAIQENFPRKCRREQRNFPHKEKKWEEKCKNKTAHCTLRLRWVQMGSGRAFSRKNYRGKLLSFLRCEKSIFCSLRAIYRQHNFNYECRMKNVVVDFSCDISFFRNQCWGNEKSFLAQLSINWRKNFCMLCKWNNSSSFGTIFPHSTVG